MSIALSKELFDVMKSFCTSIVARYSTRRFSIGRSLNRDAFVT